MKYVKDSVCRLCLSTDSKLINVFENGDDENNNISIYIYQFFAVEIKKTDPYSRFVCKSCWDIITTFCRYRVKYRKNDALLHLNDGEILRDNTVVKTTSFSNKLHPSVKQIFQNNRGIRLQAKYWHENFDPKVHLSRCEIPATFVQERSSNEGTSDVGNFIIKNTYTEQTVENNNINDEWTFASNSNYDESSTENSLTFSDTHGVGVALGKSTRSSRRPRKFGNPYFFSDNDEENYEADPLEILLREDISESVSKELNTKALKVSPKIAKPRSKKSASRVSKRLSDHPVQPNLKPCVNKNETTVDNMLLSVTKRKFQVSSNKQGDQTPDQLTSSIKCPVDQWDHFFSKNYKPIISANGNLQENQHWFHDPSSYSSIANSS